MNYQSHWGRIRKALNQKVKGEINNIQHIFLCDGCKFECVFITFKVFKSTPDFIYSYFTIALALFMTGVGTLPHLFRVCFQPKIKELTDISD